MSAGQKFMGVVKGLILSYLLTIIMLFITAVVVYKVGISDKVLGILVVVIYIVATFAGGFVTAEKSGRSVSCGGWCMAWLTYRSH